MATKRPFPISTTTITTTSTTLHPSNNTTTASGSAGNWEPPGIWEASMMSVKIGCALEAVLILTSNLALLLVIVTSPALRRQMRYRLVVSLVVSHLTVGLLSAPFYVDTVVRMDWVHGCYFGIIRSLVTMYVQNFVSTWGLVLLLLHYLARVTKYEGPAWLLVRLPPWLNKALPGVIVASPWIVALLLQVPLVFLGLHRYSWVFWSESHCPLILQLWAAYLLAINSYFIPAIVLIVLSVIIIVRFRDEASGGEERLRRAETGTASLVSANETDTESGTVHVVAAVLTVLLMGPENVFYGLRLHTKTPFADSLIAGIIVVLLEELLPIVLAVLWMLMLPGIRQRLWLALSRLRGGPSSILSSSSSSSSAARGGAASSVGPVSFRDLRDE